MLKNILNNGESLAYVKDQLGHSSIRMTVDVYGHLVPGANRQAVNKLPSLDESDHIELPLEGQQ
jgi:integrase